MGERDGYCILEVMFVDGVICQPADQSSTLKAKAITGKIANWFSVPSANWEGALVGTRARV